MAKVLGCEKQDVWLDISIDHERLDEIGIEKPLTFYVTNDELERFQQDCIKIEKTKSIPLDLVKRPIEAYRRMLFDLVLEDWKQHKWRYGVSIRILEQLDEISSNKDDKDHKLIFEMDPFLIFRKNNGKKSKLEDLGRALDRIKKDLVKNGEVPKSELPKKHI